MKLSAGRKLCFGVGALGKDLCYAMISTFLMIYFTDTVGLNPLFVGNLFLVARVWDAVNDPMMGFMVDNTRSRWGKFRPWIIIGTLLNAGIMVFMFRSPDLEGAGLYAYYAVMYILWGMTYTVMDIPYWSMLPSLSSTQKERESMSVIPRIFASSAWLLMGAFGIALRNRLGNGDEAKGYASLSVLISVVFIATILITVIFVKDRSSLEAAQGKKAERISLKEAIHVITANDQLKVYIGVVLAYNMLVQLAGGMAMYYFKYVTGDEGLFSFFTTAASFAEIIALFAFPVLSRFMSKKQVFAVASFTPAVGLIALLVFGFVAPTNIPLIILCGLLFKFGSGLTLGTTTVMLADVIDYGEVKLGTRNESIVASFQTLLVKTASAVAGWLIGVGLTIVGYVKNVPQTPETIMGMRVLMGVIPSIVTVLAFVIYVKGYKLDGSFMENITKQLQEKDKVSN
ncbi:MAG: melibiose:sodium transporter MelB [Enterocloster citroniae]|jgi:melibiose permease|nr:melibiose:sodium transporter MelB [Enterocloster citroniae]